jgi:uncharacterized protein YxjI
MRIMVPVLYHESAKLACSSKGDNDQVNVQINSRFFSKGYDLITPSGNFSAAFSPFGEMLVSNVSGTQIARITNVSLLSNAYDIIISGGGLYQFNRDRNLRGCWICTGEGRVLQLSRGKGQQFTIIEEAETIAEGAKAWLTGNYAVNVLKAADFKLVICIFIVLKMSNDQSGYVSA